MEHFSCFDLMRFPFVRDPNSSVTRIAGLSTLAVCMGWVLWTLRLQGEALRGLHAAILPSYPNNTTKEVPLTMVIPCHSEDFRVLPMVLHSLAAQTVKPFETILVLSFPPSASNGTLFTIFNGDSLQMKDEFFDDWAASKSWDKAEKLKVEHKLRSILQGLTNMSESMAHIPNLKIFIRSGKYFAGHNRIFGADQASNSSEVISFFDCDDYLHPERTEIIYNVSCRSLCVHI